MLFVFLSSLGRKISDEIKINDFITNRVWSSTYLQQLSDSLKILYLYNTVIHLNLQWKKRMN